MARAGGGGQGDQSEGSTGILWIIAAFLVFGAVIWIAFKEKIAGFYFSFKLWEIGILSHFTNRLDDVRAYITQTPYNQLTLQDVVHVGNVVGDFVRVPVVLLIFILAFMIYFANSTRLYKRVYSMKDLAELEKVNWPQITPVLGLNLEKQNIDKGIWAMAQTPMQFCKRYKLLQEHKPQPREGMTRKEWNRIEVTLKRSQANKLFAIQLGSVWQGTHKLPVHARALFAAFAARYHNDTKTAEKFFAQMSASSKGQIDYSGVDELLKKYEGHNRIQEIVNQHAYILTVMASMLEVAREDGVQASADFLWLKTVDRKLWYMLNTVGRQTPFVEVAGPYAHWVAEKQIGRRLLVPMVEEATNALEIALKEIIYNPDEV